jgi:NDP-hexose-3-ketoreductase
MNTKKLRIGVLGCSSFAMRSVLPAIKVMHEQFELVAVASRSIKKATKFAETLDVKKSFSSYNDLIDMDNLDAVYIPLPNSLHFMWVEKSLKKKLHVFVEKSMACTYDEVKYLNELASINKCVLVENFHFRFHNQLSTIKKIVADGIIGELRCVRSSFGFPPFSDNDNIRYKKELGGGALYDAGAYPIKIAQIFLGNEIDISAANLYFDKIRGVDLWGGAYLTNKKTEQFAEIAFGFDNFYQCNLELWGSKGKIHTDRIFTAPPRYGTKIMVELSSGNEVIDVEPCNHYKNILFHFYKLVCTQKDISIEYFDNINQARLLTEVSNIASNN